jgi:type II secretory pathway pseudopilin PulG
MILHRAYRSNLIRKSDLLRFSTRMKAQNGFTLVEILLVAAAAILIAALTMPIGIRFFQTQTLDETSRGIKETLRRAQNQAVFAKNDSAFGVEFLSGSYVLFEGDTYASRVQSEDESFDIGAGITTSGITEIVFTKRAGTTTAGTLTVSFDEDTKSSISVNEAGKVERQ